MYIYCDFKDPATHNISALLSTLMRQLLEQTSHTESFEEIKSLQELAELRRRSLTEHEIAAQFSKCTKEF